MSQLQQNLTKLVVHNRTIMVLGTLFLMITACVNEPQQKKQSNTDQNSTVSKDSVAIPLGEPIWQYDYEKDSVFTSIATPHHPISAEEAVQILNRTFEGKVRLTSTEQNNDTLVVAIPNSEILTERMGSAGARAYIAVATYTLTEVEGVNYITFHFAEGSHAMPGTYSRSSFNP